MSDAPRSTNQTQNRWASERGQSLLIFTLALTVLIGFASLTIDVGRYMMARQERQNAADAAALAGTAELPASPDRAISEARRFVLTNGLQSSDIESITVSSTHMTNDTVNVQLRSPFEWGLAGVLGLVRTEVVASAAANVGSPSFTAHLQPWAVIEGAIDWNGGETVLKYDSNDPQNGNFGSLALDGNGASTYTQTIQNGSTAVLCASGQPGCLNGTATTQPGNMVGPTSVGVDYLISNTSDACDTFAEVFQTRPDGSYGIRAGCNPWAGATDSKRVILLPVIGSLCNGACDVTILYFAVFFLNTLDTCTGNICQVTGQFAKVMTNPGTELGQLDSQSAIRSVRLIS